MSEENQPRLIEDIPGSTEIGWQPTSDGLTKNEWVKQIKAAQKIERGILWVIGDLLNWGEANLADEVFQGYEFHYEPATIRRARNICAEYPIGERRVFVSIWKHEVLSGSSLPKAKKDEILDDANQIEEGGLTMDEIRDRREEAEQEAFGKPEKITRDDGSMFEDAAPECPTCGSESDHWKRTPPELHRDPGTGSPAHLRAV